MMKAAPADPDMILPADPERRLQIAISLLQYIALSQDSGCSGKQTWDGMFMPQAGLEHVIQVLITLLNDLG